MSQKSDGIKLPPRINNKQNIPRKVGLEIEYTGLLPRESVDLISSIVGGEPVKINNFSYKLKDTQFGDFGVEIDTEFLLQEKYKKYLSSIGIDIDKLENKQSIEDFILDVASTVVPCEIVMPPINVTELDIANEIVVQLRNEKAKGTKDSILYAFGLHINTEIADSAPAYLLSIMRSCAVLYDLIVSESDVDWSRWISPYIAPYPKKYLNLMLPESYQPDTHQLIRDYMELVESRNYALDMLPVFAHLKKDYVMEKTKEPGLLKPRPAFHYRLANSLVDDEDWSIDDEWDYWVLIEEVADTPELLGRLSNAFLKQLNSFLPSSSSSWVRQAKDILDSCHIKDLSLP